MTNKDKSPRTEARLPKGLQDISAQEIRATEAMLATIRGVFERYGFEPLDTPAIEYTDTLGKFLPDLDRPNEGVFSFRDDDDQWLSLRYDLTAPLARYVAENFQRLPKPIRRYQVGPVWRNEKPGPGRFRQFTQFDADTVGASSIAADAEFCMLAADILEALGVPRGDYVVKVNSRKVLDGVLEAIGVDDEKQKLTVLRAIDKLDRLRLKGVVQLLGEGRTDESGDFTKGAGLDATQTNAIKQLLGTQQIAYISLDDLDLAVETMKLLLEDTPDARPEEEIRAALISLRDQGRETLFEGMFALYEKNAFAVTVNKKFREGLGELRNIMELVQAAGYTSKRIQADFTVVRGLEYYTGPVFEAELTLPIRSKRGQAVRLGSVVSGGRYDGLVERFTGETVPATGVSVGVSRLLFGLQLLGKVQGDAIEGPVVVLVFDKDRLADYQRIVQELRTAGIRAELYLGSSGMKAQMKYADRRGSPCAIIQGGDEKAKGEVQIKDLILGATLTSIEDRAEYLKQQAVAQFAVPEAGLVKAVKGVLARQKA